MKARTDEVGELRQPETLGEALDWVAQWLTLLNPSGFPATLTLIRSGKDRREVAVEVLHLLSGYPHPSLDMVSNFLRFEEESDAGEDEWYARSPRST